MAALELKDITNLPSSLPISQIPQTQSDNRLSHVPQTLDNRLQPHPAFQKDMQQLCLQQRVAALAGNDSGYNLMDDSLTDMKWLQRMDAGKEICMKTPSLLTSPPIETCVRFFMLRLRVCYDTV
jgi:hypothetical protein